LEAQYPLLYTGPIVEHLLDTTEAAVVADPVARAGGVVVTARSPGGGTGHRLAVIATRGAFVLGVPGQRVAATTTALSPGDPARPHLLTGSARFTLGRQVAVVPVRATSASTDHGSGWTVLAQ
jgi:hypothetical protein